MSLQHMQQQQQQRALKTAALLWHLPQPPQQGQVWLVCRPRLQKQPLLLHRHHHCRQQQQQLLLLLPQATACCWRLFLVMMTALPHQLLHQPQQQAVIKCTRITTPHHLP
jgi:hypothetical protein